MPRSTHGGRHELGQNCLIHKPTIDKIVGLVSGTGGSILEIGPGGGVLTRTIAGLGRALTAVEIDEHRARRLRTSLPHIKVVRADVLGYSIDQATVVGNVPFHLTTPILRRLLRTGSWQSAVLLTQWEVARKRAGVGGGTLLSAQSAPWFTFELHGRVPSWGFRPRPSVDGGLLVIARRGSPLIPLAERAAYERFARLLFTGRGRSLDRALQQATGMKTGRARALLNTAGIDRAAQPRDLKAIDWVALWSGV